MKVRDVMTCNVFTCRPETDLAAVAKIMWDGDCGAVPVVDGGGKAIGMITDRDICMAVATQNLSASEIPVSKVFSGKLYACESGDSVKDALKVMGREKVHRLPVINKFGMLEGILSMSDIVLHVEKATGKKVSDPSCEDILRALKAVCARRQQG